MSTRAALRAERLPSRRNLMMHIHYNEWPRFSMFLCVSASVAVGLLATRGLLALGVGALWARYLPALLAAYASFFLAVWLWLRLSRYGRYLRARRDSADSASPDASPGWGGGPGSHQGSADVPHGGGGSFDGGGANASWDTGDGQPLESPSIDFDADLPDVAGGLDGDGGIVAILAAILLALLAFVVVGGAVYVIYEAPAILAEVVFEVMLASTLFRGVRGASARDWSFVLFRRTLKPFLAILAVAMGFAAFAHAMAPEARTALEVLHHHPAKAR